MGVLPLGPAGFGKSRGVVLCTKKADRPRAEFEELVASRDSEVNADFKELRVLVGRINEAGMFRGDLPTNLEVLTRSIWIVSRYWMDYLREIEGLEEISWTDQERGIRQHFTALQPCLTARARRAFDASLERATLRCRPW